MHNGKTNANDINELEFPRSAFKGILRDYAEAVAEVNNVDPAMCLMTALSTISGAVGKSFKATNGSRHGGSYLNLYTLISATSSSGKGVIMGNILKPLHDFEQEIQDEYRTVIPKLKVRLEQFKAQKKSFLSGSGKKIDLPNLSSGQDPLEYIQEEIDKISSDEKTLRGPIPFFIDNASPEAMGVALEEAKGVLFSASSEAGDIFSNLQGKYSNQGNDFTLILKGFSGDPTEFRRVGRANVKIPEPCLSSIWMAQPSVVGKLIHDKEASSQGLTARILYLKGHMMLEPETMEEVSIDPKLKEAWGCKIRQILTLRKKLKTPHEISFSRDARMYLLEFHNKRREEIYGDLSAYKNELGKSREIAIRFAGNLATAEAENSMPIEINLDQTQRAVENVKYSQQGLMNEIRSKRILSLAEYANRLESELKEKDEMSETIRNLGRKGFDVEEVEEAAGTYNDRFEISISETGPKGGRPSRILRLKTQG